LKNISKQTKVYLYTKARLVILEYGLFSAMIIAVVSVVIVGVDSNLATVVDYAKNKKNRSTLGDMPDLPIATPAVNNAAAISSLVTTVTTCWLKSPGHN
jgi:Flp pilus assembly pilin Flp